MAWQEWKKDGDAVHRKTAKELLSELMESNDIRGFLAANQGEFLCPMHRYLNQIIEEKQLNRLEIIRAAQMEKAYGYHIFSGEKPNPSRGRLLSLVLAMGLDLEETQRFLRHARQPELYPRIPRDAVVISAIQKKLTVRETNELLRTLGEGTLVK